MTAAGTVPPAKVLVLGAGVAGLQAIATARRLGAVVSAFDVRAAVREQVESLGATFLEVELPEGDGEASGGYAQGALRGDAAPRSASCSPSTSRPATSSITTALVPGRPAPHPDRAPTWSRRCGPARSIVDLAAEAGGNCELTEPGETRRARERDDRRRPQPAAAMPLRREPAVRPQRHRAARRLPAATAASRVDPDDDVIAGCLVCRGGAVVHPAVLERLT